MTQCAQSQNNPFILQSFSWGQCLKGRTCKRTNIHEAPETLLMLETVSSSLLSTHHTHPTPPTETTHLETCRCTHLSAETHSFGRTLEQNAAGSEKSLYSKNHPSYLCAASHMRSSSQRYSNEAELWAMPTFSRKKQAEKHRQLHHLLAKSLLHFWTWC